MLAGDVFKNGGHTTATHFGMSRNGLLGHEVLFLSLSQVILKRQLPRLFATKKHMYMIMAIWVRMKQPGLVVQQRLISFVLYGTIWSMQDRGRVELILRAALDQARMNYRIKSMDFESNNNTEQTKNSESERAHAHAQLGIALQRFNEFNSDGIIPKDLLDKSKSATQS